MNMNRSLSSSAIRCQTLPSGLTVLGEPQRRARSFAMGYFVDSGARDESDEESGVSHFLEHMVFKGTRSRSSMELTLAMGDLGAQANAYTSEESTVFYAGVLPEYGRQIHDILADMLMPSLPPDEFEMERKVILEEIALYDDRPHHYLFEHALRDYYGGHPAGNSVLGSVASIQSLTRAQMVAYHGRRYAAPRIVLAAAGNFDWDELVKDAEALTADLSHVDTGRLVTPYEGNAVIREYRRKGCSQAHALMVAPCCGTEGVERYAFALLSMIIGDGTGSRMYWDLIDSGLAESAGADNEERHGTGLFLAYAATDPERLEEVEEIMERILSTCGEVTEEELDRAKAKLCAKVVMSGEQPIGRLMALGGEFLARREWHSLHEYVEQIRTVSRVDISRALERFPLRAWSRFRLLPATA